MAGILFIHFLSFWSVLGLGVENCSALSGQLSLLYPLEIAGQLIFSNKFTLLAKF